MRRRRLPDDDPSVHGDLFEDDEKTKRIMDRIPDYPPIKQPPGGKTYERGDGSVQGEEYC